MRTASKGCGHLVLTEQSAQSSPSVGVMVVVEKSESQQAPGLELKWKFIGGKYCLRVTG